MGIAMLLIVISLRSCAAAPDVNGMTDTFGRLALDPRNESR
jgi:hypothetical protein